MANKIKKQSARKVSLAFKRWGSYNKAVFETLYSKCYRETRFGRLANVLIYFLYLAIKILKKFREDFRDFITRRAKPKHNINAPWHKELSSYSASIVDKKILIIAELSIPQCKRYRVDQKVDAFKQLGYQVAVKSFTDSMSCFSEIALSKLVIFYRTPYWESVKGLINECKRQGIPTFYDIDDLVFDVNEYKSHPVLAQLTKKDAKNLLDGAELYQKCLSATSHVIVSTETLASYAKRYSNGQIFIVENALDSISTFAFSFKNQISKNKLKNSEKVVIGYGSGTNSHDHDFALIAEPLSKVMREYRHVYLALHGPLKLGAEFDDLTNQIYRIPFLNVEEYLIAVSQFDINLAPLTANVFNDAKSSIKYIEASYLGVPSIISDTKSFLKVAKNGENSIVCATAQEWYSGLKSLVESKELREKIGSNAFHIVNESYSPESTIKSLSEIVNYIEKKAPLPKNSKKRVLQVNCLFSPTSFGGATLVVENLVEELKKDFEVGVFTSSHHEHIDELGIVKYEVNGIPVFSAKPKLEMTDSALWSEPGMAKTFEQVLRAFKPDIVHFHSIQGIGADVLKVTKEFGSKVVVTMHDAWWVCERQFMTMSDGKWCGQTTVDVRQCISCTKKSDFTYKRYFGLQAALDYVDLILAPSGWHSKIMSNSIRREVKVNKNGVLPPKMSYQKRPQSKHLNFAFLGGGSSAHKGYYVVKEIFESLNRNDYKLTLTDIHLKFGVPGIKPNDWSIKGELAIVPPFDASSIDAFFSEVDILLVPSLWPESFGLTTREAASRSVWVIAMDAGGLAEDLINGENANIVPMGDKVAFASAITKALDNPKSIHISHASKVKTYLDQANELSNYYQQLMSHT